MTEERPIADWVHQLESAKKEDLFAWANGGTGDNPNVELGRE